MTRTPREWLDLYLQDGFDQVAGWVVMEAIEMLGVIDASQKSLGVSGGVMEIGTHRGRYFIALNSVVEDPATPSLAIDLFDDQDLNIDGSGLSSGTGDEEIFRENLRLYDRHEGSNVIVMRADSTTLTEQDILASLPVRPRIVSVDGGHTPEHTISDIELAHAVMDPRGVVIVDDILNAQWLGVIEGVVLFLYRRPTLWPVAIGHNKLVLASMTMQNQYQEQFKQQVTVWKEVQFCGYEVQFIGRPIAEIEEELAAAEAGDKA